MAKKETTTKPLKEGNERFGGETNTTPPPKPKITPPPQKPKK